MELSGLSIQNNHISFETILSEVAVKSEGIIKPVMIDQREAGAIDKAEFFVIVARENRLCSVFNGVAHTKDFNSPVS